jgi:hypothetical protein
VRFDKAPLRGRNGGHGTDLLLEVSAVYVRHREANVQGRIRVNLLERMRYRHRYVATADGDKKLEVDASRD